MGRYNQYSIESDCAKVFEWGFVKEKDLFDKSEVIIASISAEMLYRLRRRDLRGNQPRFPLRPLPSLTANKNKQKTN